MKLIHVVTESGTVYLIDEDRKEYFRHVADPVRRVSESDASIPTLIPEKWLPYRVFWFKAWYKLEGGVGHALRILGPDSHYGVQTSPVLTVEVR